MPDKIARPGTLLLKEFEAANLNVEFPGPVQAPVAQPAPIDLPQLLLSARQELSRLNGMLDLASEVIALREEVFRLQAELNAARAVRPAVTSEDATRL